MTDQENQKHSTGAQHNFMQSTYQEFDAVYQDPRKEMFGEE